MAALVIGVSVAIPSGPALAGSVEVGVAKHCHGTKVKRCAWFNYDAANERIVAYARVTDTNAPGNYDVSTNQISVEVRVFDLYTLSEWWVELPGHPGTDFDGWHRARDDGKSGFYRRKDGYPLGCPKTVPAYSKKIRVKAYVQWKPAGAPTSSAVGEWKYSREATLPWCQG